jgi:hypothetical protein
MKNATNFMALPNKKIKAVFDACLLKFDFTKYNSPEASK